MMILLLLVGGGWMLQAQQTVPASVREANALYEQAWMTLQQEYADPGFNGQDWNRWRNQFQGKLQDTDDADVAIQTMVASLNDEYTRYLTPHTMGDQMTSIDARLTGIGTQVTLWKSKMVIVSAMDGSPAKQAGLLPKDVILKIEGKDTSGMTVDQASHLIQGKVGTSVTLTIERQNQRFDKQVPRAEIKVPSIRIRELKDKRIGYIRLSSFMSETAVAEFREALARLPGKQALILDLRQNYGGLFSNAVEMADTLLEKGDIVSVVSRNGDGRRYQARPGQAFSGPLVVLIDGGSASASEILSGALQDNRRAVLIGNRSFGKGLVQKINPLANGGGLNITVSKYLTPKGRDINRKGIEPDIPVALSHADLHARKDTQLSRAVRFLQTQL